MSSSAWQTCRYSVSRSRFGTSANERFLKLQDEVAGAPRLSADGMFSWRVVFWSVMSEITRILNAIEQGDSHAGEQLLPLVYNELRKLAAQKMAREKPGQTLSATALVHEAYVRLVDIDDVQRWDSRRHFFAAAAEAMRRILLDKARKKRRLKRGGDYQRVNLDEVDVCVERNSDDLIALDEALTKLAQTHPERAELVKLRYFAGLTVDEAAQALGISSSTADRLAERRHHALGPGDGPGTQAPTGLPRPYRQPRLQRGRPPAGGGAVRPRSHADMDGQ